MRPTPRGAQVVWVDTESVRSVHSWMVLMVGCWDGRDTSRDIDLVACIEGETESDLYLQVFAFDLMMLMSQKHRSRALGL